MHDLDTAMTRGVEMGHDIDQLKRVHDKLKSLMHDLRNQALFNFLGGFPFGALPGLQQIGSYWTPVAFTAAACVAISSMYTEMPAQRAVKSSSALKSGSQDQKAKDDTDGTKSLDQARHSINSSMVSRAFSQGDA